MTHARPFRGAARTPRAESPVYLAEAVGLVELATDSLRLIGELYQPDLAILPIGGHCMRAHARQRWLSNGSGQARHADSLWDVSDPARHTDELQAALAEHGLTEVTVTALLPGGSSR